MTTTTLPLRAPAEHRPLLDLGRVFSAIAMALEVFADAHAQAIAAQRRLSPHGSCD